MITNRIETFDLIAIGGKRLGATGPTARGNRRVRLVPTLGGRQGAASKL